MSRPLTARSTMATTVMTRSLIEKATGDVKTKPRMAIPDIIKIAPIVGSLLIRLRLELCMIYHLKGERRLNFGKCQIRGRPDYGLSQTVARLAIEGVCSVSNVSSFNFNYCNSSSFASYSAILHLTLA